MSSVCSCGCTSAHETTGVFGCSRALVFSVCWLPKSEDEASKQIYSSIRSSGSTAVHAHRGVHVCGRERMNDVMKHL